MNRLNRALLVVFAALMVVSCDQQKKPQSESTTTNAQPSADAPRPAEKEVQATKKEQAPSSTPAPKHPVQARASSQTLATIETRYGKIVLRFFPEVAPNHVKNFLDLARKGFYDGTTFHRVIPNFMVQGGDPNTRDPNRALHGRGGPGYKIKAEFNSRTHKRGTLSMARSSNPDSAGSQFFICVADRPDLDGKYTVFGEVVSGMDVVNQIVNTAVDRFDNPLEPITIKVVVQAGR